MRPLAAARCFEGCNAPEEMNIFCAEHGAELLALNNEQLSPMRGGRIMIADRFYPSTQICSRCGCLTGPKGREDMHVEHWICSECGAEHERDANAAINLRWLRPN
jgi:hypothetical protein